MVVEERRRESGCPHRVAKGRGLAGLRPERVYFTSLRSGCQEFAWSTGPGFSGSSLLMGPLFSPDLEKAQGSCVCSRCWRLLLRWGLLRDL